MDPDAGPRAGRGDDDATPSRRSQAHAREELGIDPDELGSPMQAAVSSFVAFSVGALVPLVPWFFGSGDAATVASLVLALLAAAIVGIVVSRFTERSRLRDRRSARSRSPPIPAAITYAIGSAVGVGV